MEVVGRFAPVENILDSVGTGFRPFESIVFIGVDLSLQFGNEGWVDVFEVVVLEHFQTFLGVIQQITLGCGEEVLVFFA